MDLALKSEDYTVQVEEVLGAKFMHCTIHGPWTKSKREQLQREFQKWHSTINEPLYATHYKEQGRKHEKFLYLFNFIKLSAAVDADGRPTEIWAKLTI
ncbi:MAG: hypothetical protein HC888_00875 [Candidatus Competibacteraceae bacterium]|nr:hypothetical protein [Candidatus Competibacteraceae bacterium]